MYIVAVSLLFLLMQITEDRNKIILVIMVAAAAIVRLNTQ